MTRTQLVRIIIYALFNGTITIIKVRLDGTAESHSCQDYCKRNECRRHSIFDGCNNTIVGSDAPGSLALLQKA